MKKYAYYRCSRNTAAGRPSVRPTEADLDRQKQKAFECIRLTQEKRDWFGRMILRWSEGQQQASIAKADDLQRPLSSLRTQQDTLLNMHLNGTISVERFSAEDIEIRDRITQTTLLLFEAADRGRAEHVDLARRALELSQSLAECWLTADYTAKHQILKIIRLNLLLIGVSLVPE